MTGARARRQLAVVLGVLALSAGAWPRAQVVQQPPPPGTGPQPVVGTGFISGQVVELPSGRPVPEAQIVLSGRGAPPPPGMRAGGVPQQIIITDSQGRFFFSRLPNGIYTPRVVKTGYESRSIGTIEVGDGERITDVKLRIAPLAVISGTVRDVAGDPVVGTTMWAFRRGVVNGKAGWQQFGRAVTDDRGAYRLSGLTAGDYLVCACARDNPIPFDGQLLTTIAAEPIGLLAVAGRALTVGADAVALDNTVKTFAPRFHPDAASAARATKITLAPGDDKTGVDVALDLVRATRVSGRIVGATSAVQASAVRLLPLTDAESGIDFTQLSPMLVQADGRFDFAPVPPGQYQLIVGHRETGLSGGGPSGAALGFLGARGGAAVPAAGGRGGGPVTAEFMWANEPINVGENGVSGLVVGLNPGLTLRGRLQFVGAAPQPPAQQFQRINVILSPINFTRTPFSAAGVVGQDGAFLVPGIVPGKYTVNVPALPGYPTLKSITLGGQDVTDLPLDVGGKDLTELLVTFVDTPMGSLTVTTQMPPPAQAIDDIIAIVFPADRKYWTEPAGARRRFRSGPMPPKGVLNLAELPAGDYFVTVANAIDVLDWQDAARMDMLSRRAQRVTVSDGGKQTVEVRR